MASLYEVFLQLEPRRRWLGVLLVVTGLAISAAIGATVDSILKRARPNIELAAVGFNGILQKNSKLTVTPTLRKAYEEVPLELDEFKTQITLESLSGMIISARDYSESLPAALATLKDVTSRLEKSPLDANKDNLRYELLVRWVQAPGNVLDSTVRDTLQKPGRITNLLHDKQQYKQHPDGAPWNSPQTAVVWLDSTRSYRLSDEKIFETDNSPTQSAKFLASLYRRLWIYLDRDLLLELFKETEASLNELITRSNSFERALLTFEEANNPKRIEATVVITNVGKSPLIMRTFGVLRLSSNQKHVDVKVVGTIDDRMVENSVLSVPGGESRTIKYYSLQTAKEISDQNYAGNLSAIYATEVLACTFGGLRVSTGADQPLITKQKANFGARVRENSLHEVAGRLP